MTVRNRPYQRRRRGPVLLVVGVLAVVVAVTWTTVLVKSGAATGVAACPPPPAGPVPGEVLPAGALRNVPPAPPSAVKVRVLNAGGQRGQANLVAAQLGDFDFAQAAPPTNDPLYPDGDMVCTGQLRFGQAGQGAASTVALLVPCAELVRDGRADDTVDVSVGTAFSDVNPGRAVRDVLDQLAASGSGTTGSGNADPAAGNAPSPATPVIDASTLAAARETTCR
jgi:LytR cell envelope-related transcriptional attenuator